MKSDWIITGTGGQSIVSESGSMRNQLTGSKMMLWNGRDNLVNVDIVGLVKLPQNSSNVRSGFILRSDLSGNNYYFCRITCSGSKKLYYLYRVVGGAYTNIGLAFSVDSTTVYTKVRFRVDGDQVSIEEYILGNWELIKVCTDGYITGGGYAGLKSDSVTGYYMLYDDVTISEKA